jgi:hypothetical protein
MQTKYFDKTTRFGYYVNGRHYSLDKMEQAAARARFLTEEFGRKVGITMVLPRSLSDAIRSQEPVETSDGAAL